MCNNQETSNSSIPEALRSLGFSNLDHIFDSFGTLDATSTASLTCTPGSPTWMPQYSLATPPCTDIFSADFVGSGSDESPTESIPADKSSSRPRNNSCCMALLCECLETLDTAETRCLSVTRILDGSHSASIEALASDEVLARNKCYIDVVLRVLGCPCSGRALLLWMCYHIADQVFAWYAAASGSTSEHIAPARVTARPISAGNYRAEDAQLEHLAQFVRMEVHRLLLPLLRKLVDKVPEGGQGRSILRDRIGELTVRVERMLSCR